jgi:hypothetical protein
MSEEKIIKERRRLYRKMIISDIVIFLFFVLPFFLFCCFSGETVVKIMEFWPVKQYKEAIIKAKAQR